MSDERWRIASVREFREIRDFERYSVSNDGIIINNITGQILSQREATNGYMRVNLRQGNVRYEKPKTRAIHRLVAEAFIPAVQGKDYVNHIDGNKHNNDVSNLEWCTASENISHAIKNGLLCPDYQKMHRLSYEKSKKSHQTPEYRKKMQKINAELGLTKEVLQIDKDGRILNRFKNCYEAARFLFGGNTNKDRLISRCARGKCNSAYGFRWIYEGGGLTS
jgi:hypothetical protein